MTTKKQRRANVAAKTELERAALAADNAEILRRSKDRAEQARFDKERDVNKKKAAAKIAEIHAAQRKDLVEDAIGMKASEMGGPAEMNLPDVERCIECGYMKNVNSDCPTTYCAARRV